MASRFANPGISLVVPAYLHIQAQTYTCMESSGKQTLAVKGVTLQKKTAGPFPYPPLQDAISSHQPFHAHPLLETEDLHYVMNLHFSLRPSAHCFLAPQM